MTKNSFLTILFCGDFAPCMRWYKTNPNINVFGDLLSHIQNSDLAFINLEAPATNIGKSISKDGPCLYTKPEWLKPLKESGFNLIGLANNHMGDLGPESVINCIENCKSLGLSTVGAGKNLEDAQKIYYFKKNNIRLAIIAVCEHEYSIAEVNKAGTAPLDVIDNIRQIKEAQQNADFVIITIHGGNEYFQYPRPGLQKQCKFYIEQGCDAVICHHPHVPGAFEEHLNKPIFYSLGNLIFDFINPNRIAENWEKGYAVKLFFDINNKKVTYELIPYTQSFEQGGIKLLESKHKLNFINEINTYKEIMCSQEKYNQKWENFCREKKKCYLLTHYMPFTFRGIRHLMKFIKIEKLLLNNTNRIAERLNYIQCESHREVTIKILFDLLKENCKKNND